MQTVPSKSVGIGRNLGHATARSPAEFEIEARNAADRPSKLGGDAIRVKFSAPANTTVATTTELPDGRYKVEYVAPIAGSYHLTVPQVREVMWRRWSVLCLLLDPPPKECWHGANSPDTRAYARWIKGLMDAGRWPSGGGEWSVARTRSQAARRERARR